ncbi:MAG: hypothetical protein EPN30_08450 [Actinomycetota bacterium]|nr:MAG: hypothetical protein EPN30_08450 [Actinomycetota bacterium]
MFWRSGSTSNGDFDKLPKDTVLWVVRDGQVLASCVHAHSFAHRICPALIENFSSGAAVLFGKLPVFGICSKHHLLAIHLDSSLEAIKISRISRLTVSFPRARTKVIVVAPEEILRRFTIAEGDQFELKA